MSFWCFFLLCFQNHDSIDAKAELPSAGLDNLSVYLAQRTKRITGDISQLHLASLNKGQDREGLKSGPDFIRVKGSHFPELICIEDAMMILTPLLKDIAYQESTRAELLHRGVRFSEIDGFLDQCSTLDFQTYLEKMDPEPEVKAGKLELQASLQKKANAWTIYLLENLSVPSRRALLFFLYEKIVPDIWKSYSVSPLGSDLLLEEP